MMRRRMAQMNARMNAGMNAGGGGSHGKDSTSSSTVANTPQYIQQPANPGPGKPGMNAQPNQAVMDAVKKVREEPERQSQPMTQAGPPGAMMNRGQNQQPN